MSGCAVMLGSYLIAVAFAWYFSGSYLSAATSLPWAIAGGLLGAWLWVRESP